MCSSDPVPSDHPVRLEKPSMASQESGGKAGFRPKGAFALFHEKPRAVFPSVLAFVPVNSVPALLDCDVVHHRIV